MGPIFSRFSGLFGGASAVYWFAAEAAADTADAAADAASVGFFGFAGAWLKAITIVNNSSRNCFRYLLGSATVSAECAECIDTSNPQAWRLETDASYNFSLRYSANEFCFQA